jgi:enamine deaminase RidA (YjgF/YER057c/UK114 family)
LRTVLPPLPQPIANYVPFVISQDWVVISGPGPKGKDGKWCRGRAGLDIAPQQPYEHARLARVHVLSVAKAALGKLDRGERIVKVVGIVNGTLPQVVADCRIHTHFRD